MTHEIITADDFYSVETQDWTEEDFAAAREADALLMAEVEDEAIRLHFAQADLNAQAEVNLHNHLIDTDEHEY